MSCAVHSAETAYWKTVSLRIFQVIAGSIAVLVWMALVAIWIINTAMP